jgi:hypothetical protein
MLSRTKILEDLNKLSLQIRETNNQVYFGYGADLDFTPIMIYTFRDDGTLDNVEDNKEIRYFNYNGELIAINKTWSGC